MIKYGTTTTPKKLGSIFLEALQLSKERVMLKVSLDI